MSPAGVLLMAGGGNCTNPPCSMCSTTNYEGEVYRTARFRASGPMATVLAMVSQIWQGVVIPVARELRVRWHEGKAARLSSIERETRQHYSRRGSGRLGEFGRT